MQEEELGYLKDSCIAWIDTPLVTPTKDSGPFGLVKGSGGAPEVQCCNTCNLSRKSHLSDDTLNNLLVKTQALEASMKLPQVRLH